MAQSFDATLKYLMETYPHDWVRLLGIDVTGPVEAVDADLATVSAAADKVFRLAGPEPWLLHLEVQSSYKADLPDRIFLGNALLHRRHNLPVQSVAVLLRPGADGTRMNGEIHRQYPPGRQYLSFRYDVVRIWQMPLDAILASGVGILPLAPLTDESQDKLPAVIDEMKRRLKNEAPPDEDASIWTATYVLMGLRYSQEFAAHLLQGVRGMEDSVTYQAIVEKGLAKGLAEGRAKGRAEGRAEGRAQTRVKTARELLLDLGTRKFGKPDRKTSRLIAAIDEYKLLKRLNEQLLEAECWKELLGD